MNSLSSVGVCGISVFSDIFSVRFWFTDVGVGLSLSLSLVVGVVSGVIMSWGFGMFCSSWYLLFVITDSEVKISSCCCVAGNGFVSGIIVGSSANVFCVLIGIFGV